MHSTVQTPTSGETAAEATRVSWVNVAGRRRRVAALIGIVALALALRAGVYADEPRPFEGAGLTATQGEMARNIVDHGRWFVMNTRAYELVKSRQIAENSLLDPESVDFTRADRESSATPVVHQMPGLAVILAGVWWLSGSKTYQPIQWLQILLDAAMVLLIYWIGARLARSTRVGLVAALLYAVWPGAIVVAKRPMLDTWAGFITIGCVALFVWARERPHGVSRLVALGLLTGIGIYFRPFFVLLPIALALVATPDGRWRRRFVWAAVPTATALLVLAPWSARNYVEFDRFIPTRTGLGQAVFEGIGEAYSDEEAARHVRENRADAAYGSPAYDDFLLGGAIRAIIDDPGWYLGLIKSRLYFLLPCLLAALAYWRWRTGALIPVAAAAATTIPYVFIGSDTRFYLPAAFAYIILVAMTIELVVAKARFPGRLRS